MTTPCERELHELIKELFEEIEGEELDVKGPFHERELDKHQFNIDMAKRDKDKDDLYFLFTLITSPLSGSYCPNKTVATLCVPCSDIENIQTFFNKVYGDLKRKVISQEKKPDKKSLKVKFLTEILKNRKLKPNDR